MNSSASWHCPACKAALPKFTDGIRPVCQSCGAQYYLLGKIPLLIPHPDKYLQKTFISLGAYCAYMEASLQYLKRVETDARLSFRRPFALRAKPAVEENLALARQQLSDLRFHLERQSSSPQKFNMAIPPSEDLPLDSYGMQNLSYLRVDWAGTDEGERQIETVRRVIERQIAQYCEDADSAVLLGAATGRYAVEFARNFQQIIAVEMSYSYVDLFCRLVDHPLKFNEFHLFMPVSVEHAIASHRAVFARDRTLLEKINYVIADARFLPLAAASQSAAISIYFSDVIPIHELFEEAWRILRPGGRFINFGPLGYGFKDPAGLLAPEEVRALAHQMGFKLEEEGWLEWHWQPSPHTGFKEIHQVWSYVLTKPVETNETVSHES